MRITCLASSSEGNSYIIESNKGTKILVELGLLYVNLRKKLLRNGVLLNDIAGCLVTHTHQDHSVGVPYVAKLLNVFGGDELAKSYPDLPIKVIKGWETFHINDFTITPFEVEHDVQAYGFIIQDPKESLLFINDTKYVKWDFQAFKFDYIMIESNYNDEIIIINDQRNQRTINSHMALSTTITTLKNLDLSKTKEIYLLHLSDGNANETLMLQKVYEATKIKTMACLKNGGIREYTNGN